jgi:hypothetical protein
MDTLATELSELKAFIAELKTDRAAQKQKEARESWTKYTSMSLVVIAVLAAIATQWAGKYSSRVLAALNDSTFYQAKASDQWSFYQAKSIKQNLYEIAKEQAAREADPKAAGSEKQAAWIGDKIARYEADKQQIKGEAGALEQKRDETRTAATEASRKGADMGMAISIFQISIAMGSICLVAKKKPLWYFSLLLAVIAVIDAVRVWLM